jgi:hypothetical protein
MRTAAAGALAVLVVVIAARVVAVARTDAGERASASVPGSTGRATAAISSVAPAGTLAGTGTGTRTGTIAHGIRPVTVGVMQVGLDPVMVEGGLVGATVSYIVAVEGAGTTEHLELSDDFHARISPAMIVTAKLDIPPGGCSSVRNITIRATDEHFVERGRAVLPVTACTDVVGRSPADWARTTMLAGRPVQLMWSLLRNHRLPNVLGSIPDDWNDIRPAFTFVGDSCTVDCAFPMQMLVAIAALDSLVNVRFATQHVTVPTPLAHHAAGSCITMNDLLGAVDAASPLTESSTLSALVETLSAVVQSPVRQLQCR